MDFDFRSKYTAKKKGGFGPESPAKRGLNVEKLFQQSASLERQIERHNALKASRESTGNNTYTIREYDENGLCVYCYSKHRSSHGHGYTIVYELATVQSDGEVDRANKFTLDMFLNPDKYRMDREQFILTCTVTPEDSSKMPYTKILDPTRWVKTQRKELLEMK